MEDVLEISVHDESWVILNIGVVQSLETGRQKINRDRVAVLRVFRRFEVLTGIPLVRLVKNVQSVHLAFFVLKHDTDNSSVGYKSIAVFLKAMHYVITGHEESAASSLLRVLCYVGNLREATLADELSPGVAKNVFVFFDMVAELRLGNVIT